MEKTKVLYTLIDYQDEYVQPILQEVITDEFKDSPFNLHQITSISNLSHSKCSVLVWAQYEALPFDHVIASTKNSDDILINAYVYRKALIRKHYLATTIRNWLVKYPQSCLAKHAKQTLDFEVDYAQFLDEALMECYDLNESMERNEALGPNDKKEWWILKAGMGDRAQGIRLFSSLEELTAIFEEWESHENHSEVDDDQVHSDEEKNDSKPGISQALDNGVVTSQMRHFIAQPYIDPPLILERPFESAGRKFHIRTYVIAVGALKVYVYKPMLALFAVEPYRSPSDYEDDPNEDLECHLTNTCLQTGERDGSVHEFWKLPGRITGVGADWKDQVWSQICETTGAVFEAAAKGMMMDFQPLPNAFEIYGLDYLVDASGNAYLLEVNAFPDFAQTGDHLSELIRGLFIDVVNIAVKPRFGIHTTQSETITKVLDIDLGRN